MIVTLFGLGPGNIPAQEFKLIPSDLKPGKWFGASVDIEDSIAVIGAFSDDEKAYGNGAVYIFHNSQNTWTQKAKLLRPSASNNDYFGKSISFSNMRGISGCSVNSKNYNGGAVEVFEWRDSTWKITSMILPEDYEKIDFFGDYLALHKNQAIISARGDDDVGLNFGAAYIFEYIDGKWKQQAKFSPDPTTSKDYSYGESVAINDSFALVGSREDFTNHFYLSGAVYAYKKNSDGSWTYDQMILPDSAYERAQFGYAVALHNNYALIGAPGAEVHGVPTGCGYLYEYQNGIWVLIDKIIVPGAKEDDFVGFQLDLNDCHLVINSSEHPGIVEAGEAYWFHKNQDRWEYVMPLIPKDQKGYSRYAFHGIELSDHQVIITAMTDLVDSMKDCGSAYIYNFEGLQPDIFHLQEEEQIILYPNPNKGFVHIQSLSQCMNGSVTIYDVLGRVITTIPIQENQFDLSFLSSGMYLVELHSGTYNKIHQLIKI